jgi:cysteine desulfurase
VAKSNTTKKHTHRVRKAVYLDYASSVDPNAHSIHSVGVTLRKKLEHARARVADVLSARPSQIIFTSGGTESNNLAINGVVWSVFEMHTYLSAHKMLFFARRPAKGISKTTRQLLPHIVTTNIEHASVLETCRALQKRGIAEFTCVEVEPNGIVDPKKIKKAIKENTVLVSVMYANNEIGTIQPIKDIAKEVRYYRKNNQTSFPFFHTDAVQAVNYLELNVEKLGVDFLSLSGSKIEHSGKVGMLYVRNRNTISPILFGGDQEMGLRPGTERVQDIVAFADALADTQHIKEKEGKRLSTLREYFLKKIAHTITSVFGSEERLVVNGDRQNRLPNNVNITIHGIPSDLLVIELSVRGIYVSSKSACKSGDGKVSHVISAINPDVEETNGVLRFSFGRSTTKGDLDYTVTSVREILHKLKKWYS